MERPYVLHMFTPGRQMSPFDVNMAADAGYQIIVPYCEVGLEGIAALTQDTIFSRGPKGALRTGIFIGGRDALLAADMLERAKAAMMKPFVVSLLADPSGAYTTAAAMVARVESALLRTQPQGLAQQRVLILGGTGPVGRIAGVLAARCGAEVSLSSRSGLDAAEQAARATGQRFGVTLHGGGGRRSRFAAQCAGCGRRGAGLCGSRHAGGVERGPGRRQAPESGGGFECRAARGHRRPGRDGRRQATARYAARWASARWRSAT